MKKFQSSWCKRKDRPIKFNKGMKSDILIAI